MQKNKSENLIEIGAPFSKSIDVLSVPLHLASSKHLYKTRLFISHVQEEITKAPFCLYLLIFVLYLFLSSSSSTSPRRLSLPWRRRVSAGGNCFIISLQKCVIWNHQFNSREREKRLLSFISMVSLWDGSVWYTWTRGSEVWQGFHNRKSMI